MDKRKTGGTGAASAANSATGYKGYVFSVDALLSVIVLSMLLASISFFSARAYPETFPLVSLQMKTNDMLVVLDKQDYFSGMDGPAISSFMNGTFDPNVGWRLNAEYYDYTVIGENRSFALSEALLVGDSVSEPDNIASATRVFIVRNGSSVAYYGRVNLLTWFK